jgi:hypothetical protein
MIVYFKCLCRSAEKLEAKRLRETHNAVIRVVKNNPEWRKEVAKYKMKLPFIVENGEARPLWT